MNDMKEAMKAKDKLKLNAIRMLRSAIRNKEIETQTELDDDGVLQILANQIKRRKDTIEQARMDLKERPIEKPKYIDRKNYTERKIVNKKTSLSKEQRDTFKKLLEDLIGTRGAYILDQNSNILGKVPTTELVSTIRSLGTGIFAVIFDGVVDREIINAAERANIQYVTAMKSTIVPARTRIEVLKHSDF